SFGSGGAEQYPRLGAVSIRPSFEEDLDSVQSFLSKSSVIPQLLGSLRASPFNSGALHVFGDVKIAAAVVMRPIFLLKSGHQLSQGLLFFRHDVCEQQRIQDSVALRKI